MKYVDPYAILETSLIVCAHPVEGQHEDDGCYAIALLLDAGQTVKRVWIDYPDKATRDAAFAQIGEMIGLEEAEVDEE